MADRYAAAVVGADLVDAVGDWSLESDVPALLRRLSGAGLKTAVLTTSGEHARTAVAAHVGDEVVVASNPDGAGPCDPAALLEVARRLGANPGTCVVITGTERMAQAASKVGCGLTIGVDPTVGSCLSEAGADRVVAELADLPGELLCGEENLWVLAYRGFDEAREGTREALLTLGNGYQAVRGAMSHCAASGAHYPGTYVAGIYNRLRSTADGHEREDESMVNLPNWLPLSFRAAGCDWFAPGRWKITAHRVELDLSRGVLTRQATATDAAGRRTRLYERRIVSMDDPHVAAIEVRLAPENWSGLLEVRSSVDADVHNRNVSAQRLLAGQHLSVVDRHRHGAVACIVVETTSSRIRVAVAARTMPRAGRVVGQVRSADSDKSIADELSFDVRAGEEITVEKIVAIFTGRDCAIADPATASLDTAAEAGAFESLLEAHVQRWAELWGRFHFSLDVRDGDDDALSVRLHLAHLLQTLSVHTIDVDAGIPARGLHGEGYCGRVFWDELFVFPLFELRLPELTRALLAYRWRRLGQARRLASAEGGVGARFPWQSGSDGREETPLHFFNPRSGRWMPDHSRRQSHVNLAVAYNTWRHWQITTDLGYLARTGAELLIECARFFASTATYDEASDRYDLRGVMGPDEFHDGYPDRPGEGVDNNAYVNIMAAWALSRAREAFDLLGPNLGHDLRHRLNLDTAELDRWDHVSRRLRVPFLATGLLAQFEGYDNLAELDWRHYRERYGNIGRLDLILEAEGDAVARYQASKQADVLMLFYLFTAEELTALLGRLGYDFDPATIPATIDHYLARTSHGSTLSRVVHAWVLARTDRTRSWQLFRETLRADLADTQGGTTREGVHLGAMAGSVDMLQRCYTGLDARGDVLWFNPLLPAELRSLELLLRYRDQLVTVRVDHAELTLRAAAGPAPPVRVAHVDIQRELPAGATLSFELPRPRQPFRRLA